jgi:hypothetical protein
VIEPRAAVVVDPSLGLDRMRAAELLAGPVRVDRTHKQVSGDGVSWSVQVSRRRGHDRRAVADVTFGPTRVAAVAVRATDAAVSAARS